MLLNPRRSTRALWRLARTKTKSLWRFLHGYTYVRWPYGYIGSAIGERRNMVWKRILFAPFIAKALNPQAWGKEYHGKAMPTEDVVRLLEVDQPIETLLPEQVIPWETARELVLDGNGPFVALDCPCRLARKEPCYPLDVCLIIGEPFASFVLEHHTETSREISRVEAIEIIHEEARRGHVHHAFFKEAMGGRFYAICNCCSCCCGAISAHRSGTPMLISSGYVAVVDLDSCVMCGKCAETCAFDAMLLHATPRVDATQCMGCGACANVCPQGAISLVRDDSKPAPLDVTTLKTKNAMPKEMARILD